MLKGGGGDVMVLQPVRPFVCGTIIDELVHLLTLLPATSYAIGPSLMRDDVPVAIVIRN